MSPLQTGCGRADLLLRSCTAYHPTMPLYRSTDGDPMIPAIKAIEGEREALLSHPSVGPRVVVLEHGVQR
jgi:hypothetical protein